MKIEKEYIAQAVGKDQRGKPLVRYQAANKDKAVLEKWFKEHVLKGTFSGLEPHIRYRYLVNGKPFHVEQRHYLIIIIIALLILNILLMVHR